VIKGEWVDNAIVLRTGVFREADMWLRILCRERGLVTVFAFGATRSRRRFCGCLDRLNTLLCHVRASGRGAFLNLTEATLVEGCQELRRNWRRMAVAANCLSFVEAMGVPAEGAADAFALVETLRTTLERDAELPSLFTRYFRLRLAGALGVAPRLDVCERCSGDTLGRALFLVNEGSVRCTRCPAPSVRYVVPLSEEALALLRRVQRSFPTQWPEDEPLREDRRCCAQAIDGFVQYHLGLDWRNGRFQST
jgi:DNA repair protein RecO (recombination protein O)